LSDPSHSLLNLNETGSALLPSCNSKQNGKMLHTGQLFIEFHIFTLDNYWYQYQDFRQDKYQFNLVALFSLNAQKSFLVQKLISLEFFGEFQGWKKVFKSETSQM
jgi:hypothetical protein